MSFKFDLSGHIEAGLEEARAIETDIYRRVKAFVSELRRDYAAHVHGAQWSGQHTGPVDLHAAAQVSPPEQEPPAVAPPGGENPPSPPEPPGPVTGSPEGGEAPSAPPVSEQTPSQSSSQPPGTADTGGAPSDHPASVA